MIAASIINIANFLALNSLLVLTIFVWEALKTGGDILRFYYLKSIVN
jgi:hypothetical protein